MMSDELLNQVTTIEEERRGEKSKEMLQELSRVRALTNKFKLALLRGGQKEAVKDW